MSRRFGGPSRSVPALCNSLAAEGVDVELVSLRETKHFADGPMRFPSLKVNEIVTRSNRYLPIGWVRRFRHCVTSGIQSGRDVILHDTGVWLPTNHFSAESARHHNVPFISSPRGMLEAWALQSGRWRKRIAWYLFQSRDLRSAKVLHATSAAEAAQLRQLGFRQPIAVVPNGIESPPISNVRAFGVEDRTPRVHNALFLSRIHPKKGLINLVKAWAQIRPKHWKMIIVGPDECGHRAEVESMASREGIRDQFEFRDAIDDNEKWKLFQSVDLFILPSFSENFGLVVGEALTCRIPVITTKETPWSEVEAHRCGWWVKADPDSIASALNDAVSLSDHERQEMGDRGRRLINANYTWESVARRMIMLYSWMLGQSECPFLSFQDDYKYSRDHRHPRLRW